MGVNNFVIIVNIPMPIRIEAPATWTYDSYFQKLVKTDADMNPIIVYTVDDAANIMTIQNANHKSTAINNGAIMNTFKHGVAPLNNPSSKL